MQPTSTGRYRVHDRRPKPDVGSTNVPDGTLDEALNGVANSDAVGTTDTEDAAIDESVPDAPREEFVLVQRPSDPVDPGGPEAADVFDPLYVEADGYEGDLGSRVAELAPGYIVEATLAWADGTARFEELTIRQESRFYFADDVEGLFEAAVEAWQGIHAEGESMGSVTTRSTDGEPNGALYVIADPPGRDTFVELRAGRLPIEPLIDRVNATRGTAPRETFVLRPATHEFVAIYVVFDPQGMLAETVRDTYDLEGGLAARLERT